MKAVIKTISFILLSSLVLSLSACGGETEIKDNTNSAIFGKTDLSDYVKLGEYKGVLIDTKSDEFAAAEKAEISNDINNYGLDTKECCSESVYSGKVESGDIANIDYTGKKDGVAFEGGTAQGYDLTIGSGTFIDGFEDGLIGVNIGDTVDLDLTFPESYGNAELAGAAVVFTVKVNYVKTPDSQKIYDKIGFDTADDYIRSLNERAVKALALEKVINSSKITGYSKKDLDIFFDAYCAYNDEYFKQNGTTFEEALKSYNMTVKDYKERISDSLISELKKYMVYYSILEKEGLNAEDDGQAGQTVLDEMAKVKQVAEDFIYDNASIQ